MGGILRLATPLLLGGTLLIGAGLQAVAAAARDQEPLAAGQLLAKFESGGAVDGEVARLLASGETRSDALDSHIQRLAETLAMPLFVRRITAGRELLLEIERSAMLDTAASRLQGSADVQSVKIDRLAGTQRYWRDRLLLEPTPGGDLAQAAALADDTEASEQMQDVLAPQLARPNYVIVAQTVSAQQIALHIDLQATTLRLVEALQARADVEYAQPNFVATID